jgi:hypothetical protein
MKKIESKKEAYLLYLKGARESIGTIIPVRGGLSVRGRKAIKGTTQSDPKSRNS